jgi:hypothetical protein
LILPGPQLAYPIKEYAKGCYTLLQFRSPPELVRELEHDLRFSEIVLKSIAVRIDKESELATHSGVHRSTERPTGANARRHATSANPSRLSERQTSKYRGFAKEIVRGLNEVELQTWTDLLSGRSVAEVAAESGITRRTVYGRIGRMRKMSDRRFG